MRSNKFIKLFVIVFLLLCGMENCKAETFDCRKTLEDGSKGNDVKLLQEVLKEEVKCDFTPDGNYYRLTQACVKKYQEVNHLNATGVFDSNTCNSLNQKIDKRLAKAPKNNYRNRSNEIVFGYVVNDKYLSRLKKGDTVRVYGLFNGYYSVTVDNSNRENPEILFVKRDYVMLKKDKIVNKDNVTNIVFNEKVPNAYGGNQLNMDKPYVLDVINSYGFGNSAYELKQRMSYDGCTFIAVANAFMKHVLSNRITNEELRTKYGFTFPLYSVDKNGNYTLYTEALAMDIFLHRRTVDNGFKTAYDIINYPSFGDIAVDNAVSYFRKHNITIWKDAYELDPEEENLDFIVEFLNANGLENDESAIITANYYKHDEEDEFNTYVNIISSTSFGIDEIDSYNLYAHAMTVTEITGDNIVISSFGRKYHGFEKMSNLANDNFTNITIVFFEDVR